MHFSTVHMNVIFLQNKIEGNHCGGYLFINLFIIMWSLQLFNFCRILYKEFTSEIIYKNYVVFASSYDDFF